MTQIKKNKNEAIKDWSEMIKNSWTWAKLTQSEKDKFNERLSWMELNNTILFGTYQQRWETLNELYHMFLMGCGMKGGSFREEV